MKLKLKEHTLFEVLNELTNLYGHGAKKLCVICNDKESLDGNDYPIIDGENVTRIECAFDEYNKKLIPVLKFVFERDCKSMKLVDIIRYLERLPINRSTKVALSMHGANIDYAYKYDCKVLDDDDMWNVTVEKGEDMKIDAKIRWLKDFPQVNITEDQTETIVVDEDYISDKLDLLEEASQALQDKYGLWFDGDEDFMVDNAADILEDIEFEEFKSKTQYSGM